MSDIDLLRRAAEKMHKQASAINRADSFSSYYKSHPALPRLERPYIASWHPAVALAVAAVLAQTAHELPFREKGSASTELMVYLACVYLGEEYPLSDIVAERLSKGEKSIDFDDLAKANGLDVASYEKLENNDD